MLAAGKPSRLSPIKKSDHASVKALQHALIHLGYPCGPADGLWGRMTKRAVKRFQKDHSLTPDGIVGPKTRKTLNHALR